MKFVRMTWEETGKRHTTKWLMNIPMTHVMQIDTNQSNVWWILPMKHRQAPGLIGRWPFRKKPTSRSDWNYRPTTSRYPEISDRQKKRVDIFYCRPPMDDDICGWLSRPAGACWSALGILEVIQKYTTTDSRHIFKYVSWGQYSQSWWWCQPKRSCTPTRERCDKSKSHLTHGLHRFFEPRFLFLGLQQLLLPFVQLSLELTHQLIAICLSDFLNQT